MSDLQLVGYDRVFKASEGTVILLSLVPEQRNTTKIDEVNVDVAWEENNSKPES
jgi:hypothetical protein